MSYHDVDMKYRHIINAVQSSAKNMPGSIGAFSCVIRSSEGIAANKVNPDNDSNQLTFLEFLVGVDVGIFDDVLRLIAYRRGFAMDLASTDDGNCVVTEALNANMKLAEMMKLVHMLKNGAESDIGSKRQIKELLGIALKADKCVDKIVASLSKQLEQ